MSRLSAVMPSGPVAPPRDGFTLMEMMISITIMMLVFAMAVPFFRVQARSVEQNAQRLDARTGGRYGASSLDRDLRVAGIGMPVDQPLLVQAQRDAITINANLVSRDTGDVFAVYINPDIDEGLTTSLAPATSVTLPNSSWTYPSVAYMEGDARSNAETISYWVAPDRERPGFSALFRRVNRGDPRVVVRNVVTSEGEPVFRYYFVNTDGRLTEVSSSRLPMRHTPGLHGDALDTGTAGFIDSVRVVRVRLRTAARDAQTGRVDTIAQESSIRMMNAGLLKRSTCGAAPRPPAYDSRTPIRAFLAAGKPTIEFALLPSPDEAAGERDVKRYVLYRRLEGESDWGEPRATLMSAGLASYPIEVEVEPARRIQYGIAAMDCTPRLSSILPSDVVTTPALP